MNSNIFILFSILLVLFLNFKQNVVFTQKLSPIYANHFFSRQFFRYFNESGVSVECKTVADYVDSHPNEDWALKLTDASGVVGAGLAKGNYQFMGDFDECLDIDVKLSSDEPIVGFHGQYCTLDLPMQTLIGQSSVNQSTLDIDVLHLNPSLGICLPSACTQTDLISILSTYAMKTGLNVTVSNCTDRKSNQIEWYHVMIISVFLVIIFITLIGTLVDTTNLFIKSSIPEKFQKSLKSFSIYSNTIRLFTVGNEKETIGCFHGFRLISLLFIIIYHIYTEGQLPSANILEILEGEKNFLLQIVTNAGLWVEAFFLLSGFLCANGLIRQFRGQPSNKYNPLSNVLHRYIRLTPPLVGVIAFSIIQEILYSGPQWHRYVSISSDTCHKNWWTNLLYINNILGLNQLGQESECLSFTWYLAVDMQLFLISPILILLLASNDLRKQYLGIGINVLTIVMSFVITAVITVNNGLTPTVLMTVYDLDYINKVYKQSYCRIGPYCVGILMAYFYNKYHGTLVIKRGLNLMFWVLSIAVNLGITFLTWPWLIGKSYHNWASVLYGSTHRTIWALSWAYILFACSLGFGGLVDRVLSWKAMVPLSRLSFQAYLYHSVLISRFVYGARQPLIATKMSLIMQFFQYTVLTFIVSYVAFLLFEIPFSNLERLLFPLNKANNNKQGINSRRQVSDNQQLDSITVIEANNDSNSHNKSHRNYGTNVSQD